MQSTSQKIINKFTRTFFVFVVSLFFTPLFASAGLSDGLVGYWTLDGKNTNWATNTTLDSSGNGNTGTLISMSTTTGPILGKVGQALGFDGVNSGITFSNLTNINFTSATDARTVSAWVRTTQATNCIFCIRNSGIPAAVFDFVTGYDGLTSNGGRLMLLVRDNTNNGITDVVSAVRVDDGKWHFVSATVTSGKVMQLYVDGVASGSSATHTMTSGITGSVLDSYIGKEGINSSITPLKGQIDDVRVYNRALSATEVAQLYKLGQSKQSVSTPGSSSSVGLSNGLVGYWTFDGKDANWTTNTVADKSGNGYTGSLFNLSTSSSPFLGKIGQALDFFPNGADTNTYVSIGNQSNLDFPSSDFTVSAWVKTRSFVSQGSSANIILSKASLSGCGAGYELTLTSGGPPNLGVQDSGCAHTGNVTHTTSITDNKWHLVTGVRSGNSINVAVDGVFTNSVSIASVGSLSNNLGFVVGEEAGSPPNGQHNFNGLIDDVRVYNRALSATEVTQLYKLGQTKQGISTPAPTSATGLMNGLLGYWTLDGKDSNWNTNTTRDVAGANGNATFVGLSTTTSPVIGKIGQAIRFNPNGAVNVGSNSSLNVTSTTFSISAWIYPTAIPGLNQSNFHSSIFDRWDHGCTGLGYSFGITNAYTFNNPTELEIQNNCGSGAGLAHGGLAAGGVTVLTNNVWQHVVVVSNNGAVTFYINGVSYTPTYGSGGSLAAAASYNGSAYIGNSSTLGSPFAGRIDDVRVYNRALSYSEVNQLYKLGSATTR